MCLVHLHFSLQLFPEGRLVLPTRPRSLLMNIKVWVGKKKRRRSGRSDMQRLMFFIEVTPKTIEMEKMRLELKTTFQRTVTTERTAAVTLSEDNTRYITEVKNMKHF